MYMNNRAVEALAAGRCDDAYWWAREAIRQDPGSLSPVQHAGRRSTCATAIRREAERGLPHVLEREPANTRAMSNLHAGARASSGARARRSACGDGWQSSSRSRRSPLQAGEAALQAGDCQRRASLADGRWRAYSDYHEFHFWLGVAYAGPRRHRPRRAAPDAAAMENSTTRREHDLYAAKLQRNQGRRALKLPRSRSVA